MEKKIIKNPQNPTEEQDSIINRFDKSQIDSAEQNNNVNVYNEAEDKPSDMTFGTDYASDTPANQDSTVKLLKECESYCHEIPISQEEMKKNVGLKKVAKESKI